MPGIASGTLERMILPEKTRGVLAATARASALATGSAQARRDRRAQRHFGTRHKYQLAAERCGDHGAPRAAICRAVGSASSDLSRR